MAWTKLKMPDYKTVEHLLNKYTPQQLINAITPIKSFDLDGSAWTIAWSRTNLARNDFWIYVKLLNKYDVPSIQNAILNLSKN